MCGSSSSASSPEVGRVAAVVVAGGSGQRMGGVRKQYLDLLGEPVLLWSVRPFLAHPQVQTVVVVLPGEDVADPPPWLSQLPVTLAEGGAERGDSVWSGLRRVPLDHELVLIHDGARPFVTAAIIGRVIEGARCGGAVAAVPATDTVKEVEPDGRIVRTHPRARIWQAQTPQGFPLAALREAYQRARKEGWVDTDDAALCERIGMDIRVVEGDRDNIKITRPTDLPLAEAVARRIQAASGAPPRER
jgi:2-C-methyl-D-erythritol 4-phosphate cytidylyltransferase